MSQKFKFALIIPTCNAGADFSRLLVGVAEQTAQPVYKLAVDSSSVDGTALLAQQYGWQTKIIKQTEFNHGLTRQMAWQQAADAVPHLNFVMYLTQDVLLSDKHSFANLLAAFADKTVGAAYGRQLPHLGASPAAAWQRDFSYPTQSCRKTMADAPILGIRAPFLSDAFAAYRLSALQAVGGFPETDICEDMYVGGRLLLSGWAIKYEAKAQVYHSHEFAWRQSLARYRAIGAFHRQNPWLKKAFGHSEGSGLKLLQSQLKAAWQQKAPLALAQTLLDDAIKFFAYRRGYQS